ncbi:zinc finger (C3HC4-type RING finger) family protein [Tasmannia lanceolata]|uniref:zinc finger (C3HC4-type RING finger) family protein n=1 Tax=Tasmannia lanceolata TaxID=3420 RepID=UPI0040638F67
MGTGWRRAFCTSIPRESEMGGAEKQQTPSPRSFSHLGFFSNSSTPRLRCRTKSTANDSPKLANDSPKTAHDSSRLAHDSPKLQCKTTKSPRFFQTSNPSSPKSPSRFALLKTTLRLSKNTCGICVQSLKAGQGTAIFTAECSHAFHFPCIASHVNKQGSLICPVCNSSWREMPLLAIHKHKQEEIKENIEIEKGEEEGKKEKKTGESRVYNDDEPLHSPTGRFNPIPEADEDDDDDDDEEEEKVEEFQGFFVNPVNRSSSSKSQALINGGDLQIVEAGLLPEAAVVSVGRSHESYAVALRVKAKSARNGMMAAPLLEPARRAPIDLVTVLDVSGSMTGAKLQMLKRAMRLVISSLGSADRLSIVAFSATAKRLLPLRRMSVHGQRSARRIIDRLGCSQGTCVSEALRKATKVLEDRRERNPVASIMLLSDGQDERTSNNPNNRQRPSSHVSSTRFAHLEIPVHAFGFGNSGYTHEPAEDAFAKCVGGLLSVVVQDLRLHLGSSSAEISAIYSLNGRPTMIGSNSIRLGDLYADEERELLVELRVPTASIGVHHVLSVKCSYKDPTTLELIYCKEQALLVPRPHAVRSSAPKIERLRNLFVSTKAIAEARRLADHQELTSAHHLLASARSLLLQSSSISADENLRGLEAELAEIQRRRQQQHPHHNHQQIQRRRYDHGLEENVESLTPTSAWRAAEQLAKVAIMRKSLNRVSDLHGFENARF